MLSPKELRLRCHLSEQVRCQGGPSQPDVLLRLAGLIFLPGCSFSCPRVHFAIPKWNPDVPADTGAFVASIELDSSVAATTVIQERVWCRLVGPSRAQASGSSQTAASAI